MHPLPTSGEINLVKIKYVDMMKYQIQFLVFLYLDLIWDSSFKIIRYELIDKPDLKLWLIIYGI